jgi:hypothetical protein
MSVLDTLVQQQFSSAKGGFGFDAYAGDLSAYQLHKYLCWEHWHISKQIVVTEAHLHGVGTDGQTGGQADST